MHIPLYQIFTSSDCSSTLFCYTEWERDNHFWCSHWHQFLFRYVGVYLYVEGRGSRVPCRGSRVPCVFWGARVQSVKLMYRRENEELAKTNLESMDKTMQKLQHIGSIKDLQPQRDSVGVRSFGSGLKSECADNFSSEPDLWFALRDFVPEWNSRPGSRTGVNSRRGDSRWHNILWWDHVNKYRTMRGNRSELAPGRKSPRCHVNTPNLHQKSRETTREIWRSEGNQMISEPMLRYDLYADPRGGLGSSFSFWSFISAKNSTELDISSLQFLCKQQNYNHFSFMASQDPIQEVEGDYRNSKTSFVKGVRMPFFYVYTTGFEKFIDKFQTRIDDVIIVGIPRSGKI